MPRIRTFTTNTKTNTVLVNCARTDKIIYSYKLKGEQQYTVYEEIEVVDEELILELPNAVLNKDYTLKLELINKNGSIENEGIKEISTKLATEKVKQKGELLWSNGLATLELITTDNKFYIQYQKNKIEKEQWITNKKAGEDVKIEQLKEGDTVFVKLSNGKKTSNEDVSITIQDDIPPTVKIASKTSTTDSIMIETTAIENEYGMFKDPKYVFYYKKQGESDSNYKEFESIIGTTATQRGLSQNTTYVVKVETKDKAGNIGSVTDMIETKEVIGATGTITVSKPTWISGKASISLDTSTAYAIQYKKGKDDNWINATEENSEVEVSELECEDTVFVRLKDNANNYGSETSITILDGIAPKVKVLSTTATANSLTVKATAIDAEKGMSDNPTYVFYYKKHEEPDNKYRKINNIQDANATQSGLKIGIEYDVKVEVKDSAGNVGSVIRSVKTEPLVGQIAASEETWKDGKASVTLSSALVYEVEYRKSRDEQWISAITNMPITVNGLRHGDVIHTKLDNCGEDASISIIDETVPESAKITLSQTNVTTSSDFKAVIVQQDNQSGVDIANCKWVLNTSSKKIGTIASDYTGGTFSTKERINDNQTTSIDEIPLTIEQPGTYYLHVLTVDKAGGAIETVSEAIFVNSAPTMPTVEVSNKTTNSITVNVKSSDSDRHKLTYKLYVDEILKVTSSETVSGKAVSLTASGLSQYTTYNYYITVTDGYETSTSTINSEKTYCSGTTISCTPTQCLGGTFESCTNCAGNGIITNTSKCFNCNGHGRINSTNTIICDTCEANGIITTTVEITCGSCKGKGSTNGNGIMICSDCDGTGKNIATSTRSCSDCGGSGKKVHNIPLKCNACNETGSITTSFECASCNGEGGFTKKCSHGKNSVHYYCEHGKTNSFTHYYCEHNEKGKQHD